MYDMNVSNCGMKASGTAQTTRDLPRLVSGEIRDNIRGRSAGLLPLESSGVQAMIWSRTFSPLSFLFDSSSSLISFHGPSPRARELT
jgi:hypothetical protein